METRVRERFREEVSELVSRGDEVNVDDLAFLLFANKVVTDIDVFAPAAKLWILHETYRAVIVAGQRCWSIVYDI